MDEYLRQFPLDRFKMIEPGIGGLEFFDHIWDFLRKLLQGLRHAEQYFGRHGAAQRMAYIGKIVAQWANDVVEAAGFRETFVGCAVMSTIARLFKPFGVDNLF